MQQNRHKFDNDLTKIISDVKLHKNPFLDHIESVPLPKRMGRGITEENNQKVKDIIEAYSLMDPCVDSILREFKDTYFMQKAAKIGGFRITNRAEDHRGIKLVRWWVLEKLPLPLPPKQNKS